MQKVSISSCAEYIQSSGLLSNLPDYSEKLGRCPLILLEKHSPLEQQIRDSFAQNEFQLVHFLGECSHREIDRLVSLAQDCDHIIALGNETLIDTTKIIANACSQTFILVPVSPSTPSCFTHCANVYNDYHGFLYTKHTDRCASHVLADTDILTEAPPRMLAAGIGCALTAAHACMASSVQLNLPSKSIASLCWDTIFNYIGIGALAARDHLFVPAIADLFEIILCWTGRLLDSVKVSTAHHIGNAFSQLRSRGRTYPGERYAFGLLAQLVLENAKTKTYSVLWNYIYVLVCL